MTRRSILRTLALGALIAVGLVALVALAGLIGGLT